jgi:hypothetical protein
MSRERPDGYRINWELAVNENDMGGLLPFLIRDITPRDERVPRDRRHRNGAAGVDSLAIVVDELDSIRTIYEKALGLSGERIERDDLQADGVRFKLGPHQLQVITPRNSVGAAAERLRIRGPSILEVKLSCSGVRPGVLDTGCAHAARIVLA